MVGKCVSRSHVLFSHLMAQPDLGCLGEATEHSGPSTVPVARGPMGSGTPAQCFTPHLRLPGLACVLGGKSPQLTQCSVPTPHPQCLMACSPGAPQAQAVPSQRERLFPAPDWPQTGPGLQRPVHTFVALGVRRARSLVQPFATTGNKAETISKSDS